jgi:hypothetical protein
MCENGYIYVLILREFLHQKKHVYKIGYSKDVERRKKEYPKGSQLMYTRFVHHASAMEKKILSAMHERFIQHNECGREYFEGHLNQIVKLLEDIIGIVDMFSDFDEAAPKETVQKVQKIKDPDIHVQHFIDMHGHMYKGSMFKSIEVYETFRTWITDNSDKYDRHVMSHTNFIKRLKTLCGIKIAHGMSQMLVFIDEPVTSNRVRLPVTSNRVRLPVTDAAKCFIGQHLCVAEGKYISLKQVKDAYKASQFFQGGKPDEFQTLKNTVIQTFDIPFLEQKRIEGKKHNNVFVNLQLKNTLVK